MPAFLVAYRSVVAAKALDLRLEPLRDPEVWSILRRGNNHHTMSITFNTHMFRAEATPVASTLPCRQSFDVKLRTGYVLALAGRCAR